MRVLYFVLLSLAVAAPAQAARCKKGKRWVAPNTPLLSGPGLGYETKRLLTKGCYSVLKRSEDGSFALIQISGKKIEAGWVASGLVDATLSESKRAKAQKIEGESKRYVLRETPMRATPRFDARVKVLINKDVVVETQGKSPDGLWLYVVHTSAKKKKYAGWIPRYQLGEAPIKSGDKPIAGGENWSIKPAKKRPTPPSVVVKENADPEKVLEPLSIGRAMEVRGHTRVSHWQEQYRSDAPNDFLYKYDIQSVGAGAGGGFSYRSQTIPLVVDSDLGFDVWGFTAALEDGAPGGLAVIALDAALRIGTPLLRSDDVDLEAGLALSTWSLFMGDLVNQDGTPANAFTSLTYYDAGPYINARAYIARGKLGLLNARVSLPVGGLLLHNDPTQRVNLEEAKDLVPLEPGQAEGSTLEPGSPNSLALGIDAGMRYSYFINSSISLEAEFYAKARQSTLSGPGRRLRNIYVSAANIDFTLGGGIGMGFAF